MGKMSREKGKAFERTIARILREHGYDARRGQQYCGASGDADVIGLDGIHIEAKAVEKMTLYPWMEQSISDAKEGEMPIVIHKQNYKDILVTMRFEDWLKLYGKAYKGEAAEG